MKSKSVTPKYRGVTLKSLLSSVSRFGQLVKALDLKVAGLKGSIPILLIYGDFFVCLFLVNDRCH